MKQFSKPFRCILTMAVIAAMLAGTAVAASNITKKTIEAYYQDIKVVVDGVEITPKDANGKVVDPFISDGTTYLPVRAVGEALGKEVTWDGSTKTVYIGKVPGAEENWMIKVPIYQTGQATVYDGTNRNKTFNVAGKTYTSGVTLNCRNCEAFAVWNTNGEYSTMTLTVGHMGNNTDDAKLTVYLDGEYSTEYELKWDAAPKTLNIPLENSPNVRLSFTPSKPSYSDWGIYDISFS